MAVPVYVKTWANQTGGSTSNTQAMSPLDGNFLVAAVVLNSANNTITTPTGWTERHQSTAGNTGTVGIFTKIADGDKSVAFTCVNSNTDMFVVTVHEFSGVNAGDPFEDLTETDIVNNLTSITIPAMTSSDDDRLAVSIVMRTSAEDSVSTEPTYYTSSYMWTSAVGSDTYTELWTLDHPTSGSTPSDSVSFSITDDTGQVSFLLKPSIPPSYVQSWSNRVDGTDTNTITGLTPTNGNYLVAVVVLNNFFSTVTPPEGWSTITQATRNGTVNIFGTYADSTTSASFVASTEVGSNFLVVVHEFEGVNTPIPYESLDAYGSVLPSQTSGTLERLIASKAGTLAVSIVSRPYGYDTVSSDPTFYTSSNMYSTTVSSDTYTELFTLPSLDAGLTPQDSITFSVSDPLHIASFVLLPTGVGGTLPPSIGRKHPITINYTKVNGSGELTDFPVLVTLDMLAEEVVDGGTYSARGDGGDLLFTSDVTGNTRLSCEVVNFVTSSTEGNRRCQVWVKIPSLSGTIDTTFWVWYNDPTRTQPAVSASYGRNDVWTQYDFMSHDCLTDSTGNFTISLDSGGPDVASVEFLDDYIADFSNGSVGTYIDVSSVDGSNVKHLGAWAQLRSSTDFNRLIHFDEGAVEVERQIAKANASGQFIAGATTGTSISETYLRVSPTYSTTSWVKLNQYTPSTLTATTVNDFYTNLSGPSTTLESGTNFSGGANSDRMYMGMRSDGNAYFSGYLAHVYFTSNNLGTDWIFTEYNNQSDPSTFASSGTPQDASFTGVTITPGLYELFSNSGASAVAEWQEWKGYIKQFEGWDVRLVIKYLLAGTIGAGDIQVDHITVGNKLFDFETTTGDNAWERSPADAPTDYDSVSWETLGSINAPGRFCRISGATPSGGTGTLTAYSGSYSIFVETSTPSVANSTTWARSPQFVLTGSLYSLWQTRIGNTIGTTTVYLDVSGSGPADLLGERPGLGTDFISLEQVVQYIELSTTSSLTDCFTAATASYFDTAYSGSKDRLSNFKGYAEIIPVSSGITYVTSGIHDTSADGNSFTITGIASGDFVLVAGASDSQTLDGPTGFTQGGLANAGGTSLRSGWWYNVATTTSMTVSGLEGSTGSTAVCWIWIVYRGVNSSNPINASGSLVEAGGTNTSINCSSVTTTQDGCMIVILGGIDDLNIPDNVVAPSPYTLRETNGVQYSTVMSADLLQTTAGTEDPGSFTGLSPGDNIHGWTFALEPA